MRTMPNAAGIFDTGFGDREISAEQSKLGFHSPVSRLRMMYRKRAFVKDGNLFVFVEDHKLAFVVA
jgi:hypothetical protein